MNGPLSDSPLGLFFLLLALEADQTANFDLHPIKIADEFVRIRMLLLEKNGSEPEAETPLFVSLLYTCFKSLI